MLIVKHLDKRKYRPFVILGADGPLRAQFEEHAETIVLPLFPERVRYVRELGLAFKRLSVLRELAPDLVYCNTVRSAKWLLYAKLRGIRTILHVHELADVFTRLSVADRFVIRTCAGQFIAASQRVRDYLVDAVRIPDQRISVFHESIEASRWTREPDATLRSSLFPSGVDVIVGTVGRVSAFKGTDIFVDMAHRLKTIVQEKGITKGHLPSLRLGFLIVGGPTESDQTFAESLHRRITDLGLDEEIVITGVRDDVRRYFSLIDIFVLASPDDPFPLVNLEAMALGLPVVAFDAGGNREALDASGLLVSPINPASLAEAVARLMADQDAQRRYSVSSRSRVLEFFDIERTIGKLQALLDGTKSGKRA